MTPDDKQHAKKKEKEKEKKKDEAGRDTNVLLLQKGEGGDVRLLLERAKRYGEKD